jgi:alkylation response protein AidB-like acyl-CoA dehydrogenase
MTTSAIPDGARSTAEADLAQQLLDRARSVGPVIREHVADAERERRLPKAVHDALVTAGLQRMLTPRSLGGLEVDPITCARVVEEVARFDSAAGWALQMNLGAWWASRLPERTAEELYGPNPSRLMAGAFHPPQQAVQVDGGFRVSGRSPLASGIHDSEWVLFSAMIMDGNQPRMTEFGPAMVAFILPISDIEIIDTWYTLGMRGTDSNDGAFKDVFVPAHRTFPLDPNLAPNPRFQGPLYRFPAGAMVALFGAGVLLATARNAITEFRELAGRKPPFGSMKPRRDRGVVQATLAEAEATLRSARAFFYEALSEAWARTSAGLPNTLEHRADLLLAGVNAAKSAASVTDAIHRLAGTTGIYARSPLERYFRDAHTLRQHGFVSEGRLETVGQIYLGLPPDFPLIVF